MSIDSPTVVPTPDRLVQLDRLGDEIAELSAHLDAATARLLALIRDFDARGGWNTGFRSCAAWLSWRVGLDLGAARERVRVARCLGTLPLLADALARGELSYAKVRALTRVATPESEARLLAVGRAGTAAHVERIVRGWRRVDRLAEAREAAHQHAARGLHLYQDEDGTVVVHGISGHALRRAPNPRPSPRPVHSSRLTRWPCSRRRHSMASSIPARRVNGTRSWSMLTPRCWRTRRNPANPCWKRAATFPRKRPGAWRATRAAW